MLLVLLAACSNSVKTEYFTLGSEAASLNDVNANNRYSLHSGQAAATEVSNKMIKSIGISRIQLPDLLNRSEMVIRKDAYRVDISDTHQWGGQLRNELTLALVDKLQQRLPKTRIQIAPWEFEQTPVYEFSLQVTQFDGAPSGYAQLKGRWQLLRGKSNELIEAGTINLTRPVNGDSIGALVQAQSRLLDDLAAQWVAVLPIN